MEPERSQSARPVPEERDAPEADESPRGALLRHLTDGMRAAIAAGDHEAARVAHEAIGALLATGNRARGAAEGVAPVVDLGAERERRAWR